LGDSLVYILIAIGGMLFYRYYYNQKETFEKYFFILQAIVISGIVVNIFKVLAGRYRPSRLFSDDLYGFDLFHTAHQMLSFPSGHTTTIFAFAASMAFLFPKSQKIWWILAFFVGISRVIINAHYLSDIIGGAFLGITTVIVILSNRNRFKLTSLA
jgi:undecaprenyl-diphosphatase